MMYVVGTSKVMIVEGWQLGEYAKQVTNITNAHRLLYLRQQVLCSLFRWSQHVSRCGICQLHCLHQHGSPGPGCMQQHPVPTATQLLHRNADGLLQCSQCVNKVEHALQQLLHQLQGKGTDGRTDG